MAIAALSNRGAVGQQAAPAEPVGACQQHRVVQDLQTDRALVVHQLLAQLWLCCRLLQTMHLAERSDGNDKGTFGHRHAQPLILAVEVPFEE